MMTNLLSEKSSIKTVSGKRVLKNGGCKLDDYRGFKRPKVSAFREFPPNCGPDTPKVRVSALREYPPNCCADDLTVRETCNAGGTLVETPNERLKAEPNKSAVKMIPDELKAESTKSLLLSCKTPLENVDMRLLRVPEKNELNKMAVNDNIPKQNDILCSSDTTPRKYPPMKLRKGVTVLRDFPEVCGRHNLDLGTKCDNLLGGKSSKEKQRKFRADNEQIEGGSCDVDSEVARNAKGRLLEDIDNKVEAKTGKGKRVRADNEHIRGGTCDVDSGLARDAEGRLSEDFDNKVKAKTGKGKRVRADNEQISGGSCDVDSGLARNAEGRLSEDFDNKVKAETGKDTQVEKDELFKKATQITITSSSNSISKPNLSLKMTCNNGGANCWVDRNESDLEEYVRYSLSDVSTGEMSHFAMNESVDLAHSDGGVLASAQQQVKTSDFLAATDSTDECSDQKYMVMGNNGSRYLLLKRVDMKSNFLDLEACKHEFGEKQYMLMGNNGSHYLLLTEDDMKSNVFDVEAGKHDAVSYERDRGSHSINQINDLTVNSNEETADRSKIREVLNLFDILLKKRLEEIQLNKKSRGKRNMKTVYMETAMLLRKQEKKWMYMNERVLGAIPGIEVGDQFHYRAELVIVGLHLQFAACIDYMEKNGKKIATSIVSYCRYTNDKEFTDVLIYSGEGGNQVTNGQISKDQTLVRGNLALKNSMDEETPVRVIQGRQASKGRNTYTFTYDGLYFVSKFWQERAQNGKMVYMFQLNRMQGQPKLDFKTLGRFGKSKAHCRRVLDDISNGKEQIPIHAVNDIDNDRPPSFIYITKMVYPKLHESLTTSGCHCSDGCSDDVQCSCVIKNGGAVPFNEDGAIVKAMPIIHECGPSCKCPPSCKNRVSQHGLKYQLEVFKTEMRGWGVRSRNFISSGSFICEYVGELLNDKQAEERIGFDEYLFDIGDEDGFAIDAAHIGNIGRFVNHSCSPNLYAQDVLFDHDDKMMPHVMLFATKNIRPLQELTYDYNYKIGHVKDSNGNVKKKACHCGATKCTGRMY